ncbi:YihY/virulence factor BrkB family protein [Horticoccus luteus]|uniref:YihY/virulence factor BrkB family protein n=1 Tax=Horticoccus luteus TaxID=2862869 RepID=A0A8F9TT28_9BACT|nr:YihY/virulence factor BrkB family protein [Horticoccus luteus]QYM77788.1 YihY/virulence factor BrkB family protein [Horticoccus luteus]
MLRWFRILLTAAKEWNADHVFRHSAAVSFYTLFSLAPITVIAAALAGAVLGKERAGDALQQQLTELIGADSAKMIQQTGEKAAEATHGTWITTTIGVAVLLFGATTVFSQLQDSLNAIWKVQQKPSRSGWLVLLTQRILSFAMVLTMGFLLLVSLILTTALESLTAHFGAGWNGAVLKIADLSVSLAVMTVLFALILKVMPDVEVRWREVWRSGLVTAVLFTIGRFAISLYLAHSTIASVYGAAGSLVALLIWIYYTAAIFFYGAEFLKADRAAHRLPVTPKKTAVLERSQAGTGA